MLAIPAAGADTVRVSRVLAAGGSGNDVAHAIAVDSNGDVIVVGSCEGTVDFGGGPVVGWGLSDIFVARYDRNLNHIWTWHTGYTDEEYGLGVCIRDNGNILVVGTFRGVTAIGRAAYTSAGGLDAVVIELASDGTYLWSDHIGGMDDDIVEAVAGHGTDRFFVAGSQNVTATFSQVLLTQYRYDAATGWRTGWAKSYTGVGHGVAVDSQGRVLFAGRSPSGSMYEYFARYNSTGTLLTAYSDLTTVGIGVDADANDGRYIAKTNITSTVASFIGPAGGGSFTVVSGQRTRATGVTAAPGGDLAGTGFFSGTLKQANVTYLTSDGDSTDGFMVCYPATGAMRWVLRFGGPDNDAVHALAVSAEGDYYVAGEFRGTVDLGGVTRTSAGGSDLFVARVSGIDPILRAVEDVANDQGGSVKLSFGRSRFDHAGSIHPVLEYEVSRRDGGNWTPVRTVPAHTDETYRVIAPTLQDAIPPASIVWSVFRVRAKTADPGLYYDSPPDSGYSLDNLAPSPPQQLVYGEGVLAWVMPLDPDVAFFTVYGSDSETLDAAATRLARGAFLTRDVTDAPYPVYLVTATDRAGNEGEPAMIRVSSSATHAAAPGLSVSAHPNPFNPETAIRYELPANGPVRLEVFDARGARVRTLIDGFGTAGVHTARWAGRDQDEQPVGSGVYFARLVHPGGTRTCKIVLLK